MATFTQLASGNWRVQVPRKTGYVAETFRRRKDEEEWALDMERSRAGRDYFNEPISSSAGKSITSRTPSDSKTMRRSRSRRSTRLT